MEPASEPWAAAEAGSSQEPGAGERVRELEATVARLTERLEASDAKCDQLQQTVSTLEAELYAQQKLPDQGDEQGKDLTVVLDRWSRKPKSIRRDSSPGGQGAGSVGSRERRRSSCSNDTSILDDFLELFEEMPRAWAGSGDE